ncbi:MAG TPA: efflux RND transporter periplasmic adaptor subunit [Verrucomicrobiae bacterium]|nr:efflux RND transporter periplasmic adaptor subunit [Verrucomicrobiae bacterium]
MSVLTEENPVAARANRKWILLAVTVTCLVVIFVVVKRGRASDEHSAAVTDTESHRIYAAVAPVERRTVSNQLSIAGQFIPYQNVELHAKVAGYIKHIYVDIGDRVHTGEVLAVLEIPELVAQVDEATASVHHAEEEIQRAGSEVSRAEADNIALHSNSVRLMNTDKVRPGLIAQQELDDANAKDRASQAQVDAAKSSLSAAQQELQVARANEQHFSALSDYSRIIAPYDGVVTWRFSDTGALVQAGTSNTSGLPVVTVAQVDLLRLRIPVPESLAAKVRIGDSADVRVQATGEHFTGKVTRFTDALDPSTRTMQVEIDVPNPNFRLQPGMYADVTLLANSRSNTLTIPVEAIERNGDKTSVLVLDADNRVQRREVELGVESSNHAEVLSGLRDGEKVLVGNLGSYQVGEEVQPKPSALAPDENEGGEN